MVKPISPSEVKKVKPSIPDGVIEAFNEVISANFSSGTSHFTFDEVVAVIKKKMKIRNSDTIYKNKWLDVEELYSAQGWRVSTDTPGYCESYASTFTFSQR